MEALSKIQQELVAPKNLTNSFGGYNYRSCESILEAVKPLLLKHNCSLVIRDEMVECGGRVYVKAIVSLKLIGSNEGMGSTAYAREAENKKGMDDAQITGAASSYARKYALNGLFLIDDTKDADATNKHGNDSLDKLDPATYMAGKLKGLQNAEKAVAEDFLELLTVETEMISRLPADRKRKFVALVNEEAKKREAK